MSRHHCEFCGEDVSVRPWVLLNRFGFGSGKVRGMCEMLNEDDDCEWDVGEDLDVEAEVVSGPVLCFPRCLQTFIEGKMIEAEIELGAV